MLMIERGFCKEKYDLECTYEAILSGPNTSRNVAKDLETYYLE